MENKMSYILEKLYYHIDEISAELVKRVNTLRKHRDILSKLNKVSSAVKDRIKTK